LIIVDAGLATQERFAAATDQDALLGRLRINSTLRGAPPICAYISISTRISRISTACL
jgi:hypothetical protein